MRLYLIRHGIAVDRSESQKFSEADRPLTEEGLEKTHRAAEGIRALGIQPDLFISSPYLRARQTAEIFATVLSYPVEKIEIRESLLPEMAPENFLKDLSSFKDEEIAAFGHAPNIDRVLAHCLGSSFPISSMKKAGAACIDLVSLQPAEGSLLWLATPKILKKIS